MIVESLQFYLGSKSKRKKYKNLFTILFRTVLNGSSAFLEKLIMDKFYPERFHMELNLGSRLYTLTKNAEFSIKAGSQKLHFNIFIRLQS